MEIWNAYGEGFAAGLRGDDPRLCPYEKMTFEWWAWQKFHGLACRIYLSKVDAVRY
jgi:hypothetical protein